MFEWYGGVAEVGPHPFGGSNTRSSFLPRVSVLGKFDNPQEKGKLANHSDVHFD